MQAKTYFVTRMLISQTKKPNIYLFIFFCIHASFLHCDEVIVFLVGLVWLTNVLFQICIFLCTLITRLSTFIRSFSEERGVEEEEYGGVQERRRKFVEYNAPAPRTYLILLTNVLSLLVMVMLFVFYSEFPL